MPNNSADFLVAQKFSVFRDLLQYPRGPRDVTNLTLVGDTFVEDINKARTSSRLEVLRRPSSHKLAESCFMSQTDGPIHQNLCLHLLFDQTEGTLQRAEGAFNSLGDPWSNSAGSGHDAAQQSSSTAVAGVVRHVGPTAPACLQRLGMRRSRAHERPSRVRPDCTDAQCTLFLLRFLAAVDEETLGKLARGQHHFEMHGVGCSVAASPSE